MLKVAGLVIILAGVALSYGNPVLARDVVGQRNAIEHGDRKTGGAAGHNHQNRKKGGAALGHRSQKGTENSNAQWSNGATKGRDRAAFRNQSRDRGSDYAKPMRGSAQGLSRQGKR